VPVEKPFNENVFFGGWRETLLLFVSLVVRFMDIKKAITERSIRSTKVRS
jgi:hypothetical protein